jgi:hypothetical protein
MLMQSQFGAKAHGQGLSVFKQKLGLDQGDEDLNVMVNTCMNPWQSNESAFEIGDLFRMIVLNAIGRIEDQIVPHRFILCDLIESLGKSNEIFLEYLTSTDIPEHQYQVFVKVRMSNADRRMIKKYRSICLQKGLPVILETVAGVSVKTGPVKLNLHGLLHRKDLDICMKFHHDPAGNTVSFKVVDIPRYQRVDLSSHVTYPKKLQYFLYGDSNLAIMSHVIAKFPDFQQTSILVKRPDYLTEQMLQLGVLAEIEVDEGSRYGKRRSSLDNCRRYKATFKGELDATIRTCVEIQETIYYKDIDDEFEETDHWNGINGKHQEIVYQNGISDALLS